jgi:4-oxalocrotonate tautomerase
MPLVRIDIPAATLAADGAAVSAAVHASMVKTFNVPQQDQFQTLCRRGEGELVCTPEFLGITHSASVVFVQIFCSPGRSLEMKKALYAEIVRAISASTAFKSEDVIVNLVETARENWSFGHGIAQYAV